MVFPQYDDGFPVDADHPGSASLGCSCDSLAADNSGRLAESNLSCAKIHGLPPEVEQFTTTRAGVGSKTEARSSAPAGAGLRVLDWVLLTELWSSELVFPVLVLGRAGPHSTQSHRSTRHVIRRCCHDKA